MRLILGFLLFFIFTAVASAHGYYYPPQQQTTEVTNVYNSGGCSAAALAGASGQHNYKATNQLQWSGAGFYLAGGCDKTAGSIGLSKQLGKVFGSFNYSTDLDGNSAYGFSFSGTF